MIGRVNCYQGGHELTNLFLRKIFSSRKLFKLMENREDNILLKSVTQRNWKNSCQRLKSLKFTIIINLLLDLIMILRKILIIFFVLNLLSCSKNKEVEYEPN